MLFRSAAVRGRSNRRRYVSLGLLLVVLIAGGIVVAQFLTKSLDYYCNVDEVGVKSGCEAGRRLRIQGTVDEGSVEVGAGVTRFSMSFGGKSVPVLYDGDTVALFQECIPVVVHGEMNPEGVFNGDDIEVKHGSDYEAKNADRIEEAESAACLQQP